MGACSSMAMGIVTCSGAVRQSVLVSAVKWSAQAIYMLLGIGLTVVGLASMVLPFIPTTTTLLASSFFLGHSLPQLQNCLRRLPIIGRLIKYLDGTRIMTTTAQFGICAYLWGNLLVTCATLHGIGLASFQIVSINMLCCVLGTVFIQKFHAEGTKISQAIAVECANTSNSTSQESQVLDSVNAIASEINAAPDCDPPIQRGLPMHRSQPGSGL